MMKPIKQVKLFFKQISSLSKLISRIKVEETGDFLIVSINGNTVIKNDGHVLLCSNGVFAVKSPEIHLNPEIDTRVMYDKDEFVGNLEEAKVKALRKIEESNSSINLKLCKCRK